MANQHNFKQNHVLRAPFGNGEMRQNQARGGYKDNFYDRPVRPSMGTPHSMFPGPQGYHRPFFNPNRPLFSPPRAPYQNFGEFTSPRHPRMTHDNINRFHTQGKNTGYGQWKGQRNNFQVSIMGCTKRQFSMMLFDDKFK